MMMPSNDVSKLNRPEKNNLSLCTCIKYFEKKETQRKGGEDIYKTQEAKKR